MRVQPREQLVDDRDHDHRGEVALPSSGGRTIGSGIRGSSNVLRNALLPVVTTSGAAIGALLGGAVATETAFGVPGLATYLVQALNSRD